jgi:hypothetical protein
VIGTNSNGGRAISGARSSGWARFWGEVAWGRDWRSRISSPSWRSSARASWSLAPGVLAREGVGRHLEPVGIADRFIARGGPFDYLAERIDLTSSGICEAVERVLGRMGERGRVS